MYGMNVANMSKDRINKLQRCENMVYRSILGATRGTPNSTLRGEIGASMFQSRVMKGKLMYVHGVMKKKENELVNEILYRRMERKDDPWTKEIETYLDKIDMKWKQIEKCERKEIVRKVYEYDEKVWKDEMEEKSSLKIYRKWKKCIGRSEEDYDNSTASALLFAARSNTLRLNDRNRFSGNTTACDGCGSDIEDLNHFLLKCDEYQKIRYEDSLLLQRPYVEDEGDTVGRFLFTEDAELVKRKLSRMWTKRKEKLRV
jgi:hypothetical protein